MNNVTSQASDTLTRIRHSTAHLLAMAVSRIYPEVKLGIGVVEDDGFFHDFEFPIQITAADLPRIEEEMRKITIEKLPFTQIILPRDLAMNTLLQRGQIYKVEMLRDTQDEDISFYRTGSEFIDLCRGPHVSNTEELKAFKLTTLSGAYWKGDQTRPQLQRIYGIAFRNQEELNNHLELKEQLRVLDFRKLGQHLELHTMSGKQLYFTDLGYKVINQLHNQVLSIFEARNFAHIQLPLIRDDGRKQITEVFNVKNRSYRELPIRWLTTGTLLQENPMDIQGKQLALTNAIITVSSAKEIDYAEEISTSVNCLVALSQNLGLDAQLEIISPDRENDFVKQVSTFLEKKNFTHTIVLDLNSKNVSVKLLTIDKFQRRWEIATMYIEYPAGTKYTNKRGDLVPTVNIYCQIILEKLYALLIEQTNGYLPWEMSPRKIMVIPISEKFNDYANTVVKQFAEIGIIAEVDDRAEKMQSRVRDAELKRYSIIVIVGEKEQTNDTVSIRTHEHKDLGMIKVNEIDTVIERL